MVSCLRFTRSAAAIAARRQPGARLLLLTYAVRAAEPALGTPCAQAFETVAEIDACVARELAHAEAEFNAALGDARQRADDAGDTLLDASQHLWIAYRDAKCEVESDPYRGGSLHQIARAACRASESSRRTSELSRAWAGKEASVAAPGGAVGTAPPAATASSAHAARCPSGVDLAELWPGEYPSPVVEVVRPAVIQGRAAPCDEAATLTCTIAPGLYHPWSQAKAEYATLTLVQRFRALEPWSEEVEPGRVVRIAAGEVFEIPTYLSEGYCRWRFHGQEFAAYCPDNGGEEDAARFEELPSAAPGFEDRQVMRVDCREGRKAWIDVDASLWSVPGIREGDIVGYGEVGPAGTGGM